MIHRAFNTLLAVFNVAAFSVAVLSTTKLII